MAKKALPLVIEICQKSVSSKLDIFKILLWFILVIAYFVVGPGTLTEAWIQFCRQFVLPAIYFVTFILFVRSKWGSIALYKKDIKIKEKLVKKHPDNQSTPLLSPRPIGILVPHFKIKAKMRRRIHFTRRPCTSNENRPPYPGNSTNCEFGPDISAKRN